MELFTVSQRKVILFLIGMFFFGMLVQWVQLRNPGLCPGCLPPPALRPAMAPVSAASGPAHPKVFPVNINAADEQTLESIPGIGPALAGRIVRYREQHGAFSRCEELMQVSGIAEKKFAALCPYIATTPPPSFSSGTESSDADK